MFVECNMSTVD